ncbi:hypothetical protein [Nocardioides sp. AE5]|uniref:hypothetical protein n=1 Tax=Nocardioides sp. AE5 TaxID=2962573 RepID=UPI002881E91B|nr:hypothetical protein [Nocardioides sp. AE5]MDT0202955.1 hypothetical protein [Nocardioides sp. AE5]
MTRLSDSLPDHITLPDELEAAWAWMEAQGWGGTGADGSPFLTPYAGDVQLGVVFATGSLAGWFEPDSPAAARLLPIAEITGSGSIGALWVDDDGKTRVVALDSEGSAYVLAETALDFLRLVAIGHAELHEWDLSLEPEDEESVEAHAEFRAWLEQEYAVQVPEVWEAADSEDDFAQWVAVQRGEVAPEPDPVPEGLPADAVDGDVAVMLGLLGQPDAGTALAELVGMPGAKPAQLRKAGVEFETRRKALDTVWVDPAAYPHPERLISEPPAGEPELVGSGWVRYVVGGRYLHLTCEPGGPITQLTLMVEGP